MATDPYISEAQVLSAINHARRCVMRLHGGNLDHPALDHLEAAMREVVLVGRELRRHHQSDGDVREHDETYPLGSSGRTDGNSEGE